MECGLADETAHDSWRLPAVYGEAEAQTLTFLQLIVVDTLLNFLRDEEESLTCHLGQPFGGPSGVACTREIEYHGAKLRKVESKTKEFILFFAETEYLRRSQSYEKLRAKQKNSFFFLPGRSIFGEAKDKYFFDNIKERGRLFYRKEKEGVHLCTLLALFRVSLLDGNPHGLATIFGFHDFLLPAVHAGTAKGTA